MCVRTHACGVHAWAWMHAKEEEELPVRVFVFTVPSEWSTFSF